MLEFIADGTKINDFSNYLSLKYNEDNYVCLRVNSYLHLMVGSMYVCRI